MLTNHENESVLDHFNDDRWHFSNYYLTIVVLISRALMASPKLLILDEPCTGLDIYSREKVLASIENLGQQENGPAMIYVTHHIEEVCSIFTHALVIQDGKIIAAGPKEEVISDEILTQGLGLPLEVHWKLGRAWVQLKEA